MIFCKKFIINAVTISYGQYYLDDNLNKIFYWFCKSNYKIYHTDELIEKGKAKNADEIIKSEKYIPFSKTNIVKLRKEFVEKFLPEADEEIKKIENSEPEFNYEIAARYYFDAHPLEDKWNDYLYDQIEKNIVKWCNDNNISYKIKFKK